MKRIKVLDSLRGIAAIVVVFFHYTSKYFSDNNIISPFGSLEISWGHYGVEMFFILSGFVIILSLNYISSVTEFLKKRFIRLYPTYWICIFITCLFLFSDINNYLSKPTIKQIAVNLTMLQPIFKVEHIDGVYWSLFQELCFYILMITLWKLKQIKNIVFIGFLWTLLSIFNLYFRIGPLEVLLNLKYAPLFYTGILLFIIFQKNKKGSRKEYVLIFYSYLLLLWIKDFEIEAIMAITAIYSIFILFLFDKLSFLNLKVLSFLGKISYSLYLLHQFIGYIIIDFCKNRLGVNYYLGITIALIVSVFLSSIVTYKLEAPIIKYLKKQIL